MHFLRRRVGRRETPSRQRGRRRMRDRDSARNRECTTCTSICIYVLARLIRDRKSENSFLPAAAVIKAHRRAPLSSHLYYEAFSLSLSSLSIFVSPGLRRCVHIYVHVYAHYTYKSWRLSARRLATACDLVPPGWHLNERAHARVYASYVSLVRRWYPRLERCFGWGINEREREGEILEWCSLLRAQSSG